MLLLLARGYEVLQTFDVIMCCHQSPASLSLLLGVCSFSFYELRKLTLAGDVAQLVNSLPSRHGSLGLTPNTA